MSRRKVSKIENFMVTRSKIQSNNFAVTTTGLPTGPGLPTGTTYVRIEAGLQVI